MSSQDLDPRAIDDLARSGLSTTDICAEPATPKSSFHGGKEPGYLIPYFDIAGQRLDKMWRIKLYEPGPEGQKYTQPSYGDVGDECHKPYFAPPSLYNYKNAGTRRLIVEGEKKTVAAIKYLGIAAVGIGGAEAWSVKQSDGEVDAKVAKKPMPELSEFVTAPGANVEVVFDADVQTNPNVRRGALRLWWAFYKQGVVLTFVLLPAGTKGLDDWIVSLPDGTARAAFDALPRVTLEKWDVGHGARSEMFAALGVDHQKGKCEVNERTVRHILSKHPRFINRLAVNMVKHRIEIDGEAIRDDHSMGMLIEFQDFMPTLSFSLFYGAMCWKAWQNQYNPIQRYYEALPAWDGVSRLATFASRYLGVEDTAYTAAVFRSYLAAAIARILRPGTKFDHMLVLQGAQGIGKTRLLRALFGEEYACVAPHTTAIGSRDWLDAGGNGQCLILDELAGLSRVEHTELKSAISTEVDTYRRPYRKDPETFPRMFVCAATTNEEVFLTDPTGGRRYWPILCQTINVAGVMADRDQLWAEAYALHNAGFAFWELPPEAAQQAEDAQEAAYVPDMALEVLEGVCARATASQPSQQPPVVMRCGRRHFFVGSRLLLTVLGGDEFADAKNTGLFKRVRQAMLRVGGWKAANIYDSNGVKCRGYVRSVAECDALPRTTYETTWEAAFGKKASKF